MGARLADNGGKSSLFGYFSIFTNLKGSFL